MSLTMGARTGTGRGRWTHQRDWRLVREEGGEDESDASLIPRTRLGTGNWEGKMNTSSLTLGLRLGIGNRERKMDSSLTLGARLAMGRGRWTHHRY